MFGDTDECAEGTTVTLTGKSKIETVETNCFGDFEFERLADNTDYTVKIKADGYQPQEIKVRTKADIYLGIIKL